MKILTWNINGIRASKVNLVDLFKTLDADVICLQETKVTRDMLDSRSCIVDGYNAYFSFSQVRSGYSGVATFVRDDAVPVSAEEGLTGLLSTSREDKVGCYGNMSSFTEEELQSLDAEGRGVITQHEIRTAAGQTVPLAIINVYCPRADPERDDRKAFKLRFYELLEQRALALLRAGRHVVVLGDVNTSHRPIDSCDPGDPKEFYKRPSRQWLDRFLWNPAEEEIDDKNVDGDKNSKEHASRDDSLNQSVSSDCNESSTGKFVDTFRYIHPKKTEAYSCWNTASGARKLNYGTRIDYILADVELTKSSCKDCDILADVEGSDHCPVKVTLAGEWVAAKKCPSLCTKFMPEFAGRQTKLSAFFSRGSSQNSNSSQSSQESSQSDNAVDCTPVKRNASQSDPVPRDNKKPKLEQQPSKGSQINHVPDNRKNKLDKQGSGGKQSNLMSFFGKPKTKSFPSKDNGKNDLLKTPLDSGCNNSSEEGVSTKNVSPVGIPAEKVAQKIESNVVVASAWKSLLKGPRAAPLCKGHKEPCVLRTVKKDGLNKGRQFYTCARGEGPKTNPQSRCEHFEWVEKNKAKSKS